MQMKCPGGSSCSASRMHCKDGTTGHALSPHLRYGTNNMLLQSRYPGVLNRFDLKKPKRILIHKLLIIHFLQCKAHAPSVALYTSGLRVPVQRCIGTFTQYPSETSGEEHELELRNKLMCIPSPQLVSLERLFTGKSYREGQSAGNYYKYYEQKNRILRDYTRSICF